MILGGIISLPTLIILIVLHMALALAALGHEVSKRDGRFTFSNLIWGVVLFGLPILGLSLYGLVQFFKHLQEKEATSAG